MKKLQKIGAVVLLLAILNVVFGKAVHEIFEHHHHEHTCDLVGEVHFHESEIAHLDLICNFNFSASLLDAFITSISDIIRYQESKVKIHFIRLSKNVLSSSISLRGPPFQL